MTTKKKTKTNKTNRKPKTTIVPPSFKDNFKELNDKLNELHGRIEALEGEISLGDININDITEELENMAHDVEEILYLIH